MTHIKVGCARTSTRDQVGGLDAQIERLEADGCEKIFREHACADAQRDELDDALDYVRERDVLVIVRLDRLARNTADALRIVETLKAKGCGLRVLDFAGDVVDTSSPAGVMIFTMFSAFAQFEKELMLERQREGIRKARKAGKKFGRPGLPENVKAQARSLRAEGVGATEIARRLGIGRKSVYRALAEART